MPPFHELVRQALPRLTPENYRITSSASWEYNCVAWAAGVDDAWWWPLPGRYWPANVPREETVSAFLFAFATLGYHVVVDPNLESGVEKVALYTNNGTPTHMARQLTNRWWTSKLGPNVDIEHATPEVVGGGTYGEATTVLGRRGPVSTVGSAPA